MKLDLFKLTFFVFIQLIYAPISQASFQNQCPFLTDSRYTLNGKIIVIDPGHGAETWDKFRVGPTGEREEWINLRVSLKLKELLQQAGAQVHMTREEDVYTSMDDRVQVAIDNKADIFVSVHHNGLSRDNKTNTPVVFVRSTIHGDDQNAKLASHLMKAFEATRNEEGYIVSDRMIFNTGLGLLRKLEGHTPAVIGEFSFFSHPKEEERLRDPKYCHMEAQSYYSAIENFFKDSSRTSSCVAKNMSYYNIELRNRINASSAKMNKKNCQSWYDRFAKGEQLWRSGKQQQACQHFEASLEWGYSPIARFALDYLRKCYAQNGKSKLAGAISCVLRNGSSSFNKARRVHDSYPKNNRL